MGGPSKKGYRSDTGGITPMNIGGRMVYERERLFGMTDEERAWRKKFLKDQHLAPHEPVEVPEIRNQLINPIRRFYRYPLDKFQAFLTPKIGAVPAEFTRVCIGRGTICLLLMFNTIYYFKYGGNTWEGHGGWRVTFTKPIVYPSHPNYPQPNLDHPPSFYTDEARGFTKDTPNF